MSLRLLFRGKIVNVSDSTTHKDLIYSIVQIDNQLSGGDLELRLCMVYSQINSLFH